MATAKMPKRISLGDIESKSERVPPGHYHARIQENPLKPNKAKDGYYFNPDFLILSEGPAKNRHIWDIWPLKETALFKLKAGLVACGVDPNADVAIDEVPSLTEGVVVDIVVTEGEEYNGEPQSKIARVKPSTMPTLGDLAEDEDEEDDDEDDDEEGEEWDEESLGALTLKELRDVAKEAEVYEKGMTKADLIAAILGDDEDEDDESEDEEDEDEEEEDDLFEEEPAKTPAKKRVRR